MADEITEDKTEWYERQIAQLKTELDALNPRLNREEARSLELAELANANSLLGRESERLVQSLVEMTRSRDRAVAAAESTKQSLDECQHECVRLSTELAAAQRQSAKLHAICTKKDEGLQVCLKGVSSQLALIQQALDG